MRKLVLGMIGLASLVSAPAMAADMPLKAPVPVGYYNWSGWYGGIHGGGMWGDGDWQYVAPAGAVSPSRDINQGMIGFHIGAQWQFASWGPWGLVVGGEYNADVPLMNGDPSSSICYTTPAGATTSCSLKVDRVLTSGARLGIAYDRFMVYGTGGYAEADLVTRGFTTATGVLTTAGQARTSGWYAGVGAEYMFYKTSWGDWTIGAEWRHMELDTARVYPSGTIGDVSTAFSARDVNSTTDEVRVRLSVKVDPFAGLWGSRPIVTKY